MNIADQIKCVEREIGMRERVYPNWVKSGKMKPETAERETGAMKAVLETLKSVASGGSAER